VLGRCLPGCCVPALPRGFREGRACLVRLSSSRGDEHVGAWRPGVLYVLMEVGAQLFVLRCMQRILPWLSCCCKKLSVEMHLAVGASAHWDEHGTHE
jgi:hypothetical protein